MKVALISPKGPLYRSRGGIFRKSLRYQPLTLTTLAALAPPELDVEFIYDEGIGDVPLDSRCRSDRHDGDHRQRAAPTNWRRISAAAACTVVLGGPHVTLVPDEAQQHADAICVGYAEETWPQLLRDFAAGRAQAALRAGTDLRPDQPAVRAPRASRQAQLPHAGGVRGDAFLRA